MCTDKELLCMGPFWYGKIGSHVRMWRGPRRRNRASVSSVTLCASRHHDSAPCSAPSRLPDRTRHASTSVRQWLQLHTGRVLPFLIILLVCLFTITITIAIAIILFFFFISFTVPVLSLLPLPLLLNNASHFLLILLLLTLFLCFSSFLPHNLTSTLVVVFLLLYLLPLCFSSHNDDIPINRWPSLHSVTYFS